ncbi:MAG: hypothetical protein PHU91_04345 [Candidatus Omnitrophica bacterium]|nr:hypothetical protein [Candidatus Omnitrophota bacterium]MDD5236872.1 hypothetical protein [Candidatus Omnitrophota bacterium]MDD5610280.1 hypothetical protein [Candidatus Omnitrophota bacterium]
MQKKAFFTVVLVLLVATGVEPAQEKRQGPSQGSNAGEFNYISVEEYENYFSYEPSIAKVQGLAIEYADVEPEKISRWQKQARIKALLPKLSVGWDKSTGNTYEIYTSSTNNYCVNGPQDISSGWDVTVSWELSDLIWSTDQTSIDTRSRLTTQLRNDILYEVTRDYFERRRLQIELLAGVPEGKKRTDKELRIQELTASIDAFTGGRFSRLIAENIKRKN